MNTLGQLLSLLSQPAPQQQNANDFMQWFQPKPTTPSFAGGSGRGGMNGIGTALASGLGMSGGAAAGGAGAGLLAAL